MDSIEIWAPPDGQEALESDARVHVAVRQKAEGVPECVAASSSSNPRDLICCKSFVLSESSPIQTLRTGFWPRKDTLPDMDARLDAELQDVTHSYTTRAPWHSDSFKGSFNVTPANRRVRALRLPPAAPPKHSNKRRGGFMDQFGSNTGSAYSSPLKTIRRASTHGECS